MRASIHSCMKYKKSVSVILPVSAVVYNYYEPICIWVCVCMCSFCFPNSVVHKAISNLFLPHIRQEKKTEFLAKPQSALWTNGIKVSRAVVVFMNATLNARDIKIFTDKIIKTLKTTLRVSLNFVASFSLFISVGVCACSCFERRKNYIMSFQAWYTLQRSAFFLFPHLYFILI